MANKDAPQDDKGRGGFDLPHAAPPGEHDPGSTPSVLRDLLGEEWPRFSQQERMVTKSFAVDRMIHRMLHAVYFDQSYSGEVRSMSELLRSIVKYPLNPDIGRYGVHAVLADRHQLYGKSGLAVSIPEGWLASFNHDAHNFFSLQHRRLSHAMILELRVFQWMSLASEKNQLPPAAMKILKEPPPLRGGSSKPYFAVNGTPRKGSLPG